MGGVGGWGRGEVGRWAQIGGGGVGRGEVGKTLSALAIFSVATKACLFIHVFTKHTIAIIVCW